MSPMNTDSTPPAVRATALRKSFGSGEARAEVLRGLDLTLAPGAFEAVMGASGSGKSTLLHLVAGLSVIRTGSDFSTFLKIWKLQIL